MLAGERGVGAEWRGAGSYFCPCWPGREVWGQSGDTGEVHVVISYLPMLACKRV